MGRVFAVASAKGGVGKTTTVAALGATLATAGHDVVAVDADLGAANLGAAVGIDPDGPTIHDVLAGTATVEEATYAGPAGLAVVPGSTDLDAFGDADPDGFDAVVDELDDYEVVLLDTGAGLSHDTVEPLGVADAVLLVSATERQALGDTAKTRTVADRLGTPIVGAVLTRTDAVPPGTGETLDADVIGTIPDDPAAGEALTAGTPLSTYAPSGPAAAAYRSLASTLVDGEPADTGQTPADDDAVAAERGASGDGAAADDEAAATDEAADDEATPTDEAADDEATPTDEAAADEAAATDEVGETGAELADLDGEPTELDDEADGESADIDGGDGSESAESAGTDDMTDGAGAGATDGSEVADPDAESIEDVPIEDAEATADEGTDRHDAASDAPTPDGETDPNEPTESDEEPQSDDGDESDGEDDRGFFGRLFR